MKETDKKKPISTIPKGVWESSRPKNRPEDTAANKYLDTPAADWQGNGYIQKEKPRKH